MTRKAFGLSAILGIFALVLTAAGVLYAQQGHGGMMGMMSMMQNCPMRGAMQESPAAVLEHREELGLTAAQVTRLETLREGTQQGSMQGMAQMQSLHQEIAEATEGNVFDEAAARAAFDRMGDLHTEMGVAMLRTRHEVRQVLTPEQREKLAAQSGGMMGMHGMMQDCPMMMGGMMGDHHGTRQEA